MTTPPQIVIDDDFLCGSSATHNCFTFSGTDWMKSSVTNVFQQTQTIHSAENSSYGYSVAFSGPHFTHIPDMIANYSAGTAIEVFGQLACNITPCTFDVSLDGAPPSTISHVETHRSIFRLGADEIGNASTMHTVEISNTTDRLLVDYAFVDAPLDTPLPGQTAGQLWVNINNTAITYHGAWNKFYNVNTDCESMQGITVGDSVGLDFIGDSIVVLGHVDASVPGSVAVNVTVDDLEPSTRGFISGNSGSNDFFIYYRDDSLLPAQHHIHVTIVAITQVQFFDFFGFLYHSTESTLGEAIVPNAGAVSVPSETAASSSVAAATSSVAVVRSMSVKAGTIAGSVTGVVAAVAIAALLFIWTRKRRERKKPVVVPFEAVQNTVRNVSGTNHQKRWTSSAVSSTYVTERPQISDEGNSSTGILRSLIARVDALAAEHGPPAYST
ncbi:hypothetical protein GGX14DRAFT_701847 [Mycena pura]|uniref:Uncharacterized protein n=1 Tax=Mycena pura TaxID=153505 RepID=A0AAD6XZW2_9AGAR|nr:hypothetical protein GGX14DRAFT_701847 [Mycena pura]